MNNRLNSPDTDFFTNTPLHHRAATAEVRAELTAQVRELALRSTSMEAMELNAVLAYLANDEEHDSEGRDLGFKKQSFSRTELRVAESLPPERRVAYLRYRFRFNDQPRRRVESAMPIVLAVEPTSVCNIRCVMCFQMDEELSGRREMRGFMSLTLYRQIIEEAAAKDVGGLVLASRGEPLLHKDIGQFVRIAKDAGIPDVKLNTNATRLSETRSRELLAAGLDTLVFSVDSAVKEQFEQIRIGAKFDRIVENIGRFNQIRAEEFPEARTRTRISMVLVDRDQDSEEALTFWRSQVDEFAVRWAIPRLGIYAKEARSDSRPCSLLWERLYVWWDGTVNTCDEDYLSRLAIGRLVEGGTVTIEELWRSDRMRRYRELHDSGEKNSMVPCHSCPGF